MSFASFGRERDLEMLERHIKDPVVKERAIRQTSAAHDLNDGIGTVEAFIDASRDAVFPETPPGRDAPLLLLARIAKYYPECLQIWDELAQGSSWKDRFTVACYLYNRIPETKSDRFFAILRNDKSNRVREMAVARYEWRADEKGYLHPTHDASKFDERVARGEI
jgi:hypothetical protein